MPPEDKETDPPIIISSDEDEQKDQEEGHTKEEEPPQSTPEEEKGNSPYVYTPKSPPYPPPGDDNWETESPPELVTPDEDQDTLINQEKESQGVPADLRADKDFFHDSDRQLVVQQKFGREVAQAPWNPRADSEDPLSKLGDMVNKATPVYEGFWRDKDTEILSRLNAAARKLKERRSSTQKGSQDVTSTEEQEKSDTEDSRPSSQGFSSGQLLETTWDDLQDNLEDVITSVLVEPITPQTGPPKVAPPMPYSKHDVMVPLPLGIPANFSIKLESVAKMKTGPPPQKTKMLTDLVTQPKLLIKKLMPKEIQELTSSD